jgi:hypothetical protein
VSAPLWLKLLVLGGLLLLAGVAVSHYNQSLRDAGEKLGRDAVYAEWADAVRKSQAAEDKIDAERRRKTKENDDATATAISRAAADAASARTAADGLRQRVAALVAAARRAPGANPIPAGSSAPAGDPIGVLADVLGRCDARAGLLADYADRAHAAGESCVRAYEALTEPAVVSPVEAGSASPGLP